jgi:hypothetical protein
MKQPRSQRKKGRLLHRGELRPTCWRCRHAEFLPISSECCTARHGVRSKADMQITLRHTAPPSSSRKLFRLPLSYYCSVRSPKLTPVLRIALFVPVKVTHLRPRIPGDSCRHANPSPFPHSNKHFPDSTRMCQLMTHFIPLPF